MHAMKGANVAYEGCRKAVKSDQEMLLGMWDVDMFDVPTMGMNRFMYTCLGLARVRGGLPADLKDCASKRPRKVHGV